MESIPDTQYQPSGDPAQEPRAWQVGDLCQFPTGLVLCLSAGHTFAYFITAGGMPLADVQLTDIPKDVYFLHNTGLTYQYQSREQIIRDYNSGFFTPYFEIL